MFAWVAAAWATLTGAGASKAPDPSTQSAAPTGKAPEVNPYKPGIDQIRTTASWLIGALAAVAALLLAGTQLSSIGQLEPHDGTRLLVAAVAAGVAIVGVVFAIWRLSNVLTPVMTSLEDMRQAATGEGSQVGRLVKSDSGLTAGYGDVDRLLGDYETERTRQKRAFERHRTARDALAAALEMADEKRAAAARVALAAASAAEDQADADVAVLRRPVVHLTQLVGYLTVVETFRSERTRVLLSSVVVAAAIVVFVWAANPTTDPSESPALTQQPVPATLFLTPGGVADLSSVLGASCASQAGGSGVPAIALYSGDSGVDVVVTATGSCESTVRVTVGAGTGHVQSTVHP